MMCTSFWHPDGTPMSAAAVHGNAVSASCRSSSRTRTSCGPLERAGHPRKRLLEGLAEKGFGVDQLAEMQKIIDAEKSDLFDVLAHVAYACRR
jgi:type I restriction enzyme R subunit